MFKKTYRTYGCGDAFDPALFNRPQNRGTSNKPTGGLWASPVDSKWGWRDWCEAEIFGDRDWTEYFDFTLSGEASVLRIASWREALNLPWVQGDYYETVDFESVCFDAIYLTEAGESATRFSDTCSLYGWDCESLLVLNPDVIEPTITNPSSNIRSGLVRDSSNPDDVSA